MAGMTDGIIVLVTASSLSEAERISSRLLEMRLIACANRIEGVSSRFVWQGAVDSADECLVLMKSVRGLFPRICEEIRALHSYEVPEIIALPILEGDAPYMAWLRETVREACG